MGLACFDLDDPDHTDFLERLTHDDDLRAQMEEDALGTLQENGFDPDPADLPDGPHELPSKAEISAKLQEQAQGMSTFTPNPFLKGGWGSS